MAKLEMEVSVEGLEDLVRPLVEAMQSLEHFAELPLQVFRDLVANSLHDVAVSFDGAALAAGDPRPISGIPIGTQDAPAQVLLSQHVVIEQGIAITVMSIAWDAAPGAVAYDVEWKWGAREWIRVPRTAELMADVRGIYSGQYMARVRAVSALNVSSIPTASKLTNLEGKTGLPPAVSFLTTTSELFGIGIKWGFPAGAEDTQRTEIWYGPANDLSAATKLADLAYPQADYRMQQLLAGATLFFWARLVDRTGNVGPFYPVVGGVMGQASSEASPILNLLTGKISKTELGEDLLSDIEKIPGLQDQIDALDDILLYDAVKTYAAGDTVRQGQRLYQATGAVPINTPPPNAAYWLDVGQTVGTVGALAQQVATNKTSIETVDGKVTAQGSTLNVLRAATRDDSGNGDKIDALKGWASTAAIATEQRVRSSNEEAAAQRTTTLDSKVNQNAANVTLLESTVANNKQASAQQIAQVSAEVATTKDGVATNKAAIQQTTSALADTNGKLSTIWSVKMETTTGGQKYAASFGLGLQVDPSGISSQFVVRADTFMLLNLANGTPVSPFSVSGGQTFISSAFIQDGTITNAKIGSYISSTNYVAGQQGWILNKDGTFEINGTVPGQGKMLMTNRSIRIFDAGGIKRVQMGDLTE